MKIYMQIFTFVYINLAGDATDQLISSGLPTALIKCHETVYEKGQSGNPMQDFIIAHSRSCLQ